MKKVIKVIDLKQLLIMISSLLMIPGVLLILIQINIKMSFFGMSIDKSVATTYWQNGEGEGKYMLLIAFLSLIIVIFRNYKFIWVSFFAYLGVMICSILNILSQGLKIKDSAIGDLMKNVNPSMSVYPREGLILILISITFLLLAALIKNKVIFNLEKETVEVDEAKIVEPNNLK